MSKARLLGTIGAGFVLFLLILGSAALLPQAQVREAAGAATEAQAQTQALRDLVAEVRALRAVIEGYTVGQAQSQTLGAVLTVQQQRVAEINGRLENARRELDGASSNARRLAEEIQRLEENARRTQDPRERATMEAQARSQRDELERSGQLELQLRNRESELAAQQSAEESKWQEMIDRINRTLAR